MKFSNNTIIVNDYPMEGEHLVYNTRTQAMAKINQELKETIDHCQSPQYFIQKTHYAEQLVQLHQMGIIVENEQEDQEKLKSFLQQLKYGLNDDSFPVTILTTYACNFKCTYCFEESSRTNVKMDFPTSDLVISWIKRRLKRLGYRRLYIVFYGGEPLLNKPVLEYIATHIKHWCEAQGIQFKFMLQTNGYLMTPECIDQYLKLGLEQVRISVDGVGEDHDHYRPLRGGGKTFDMVVKNIVDCVDKVPIGISTGYDKGDTTAIKRLLDYFGELGILHKLGRFIFSPIHPTLGPKDHPEQIQRSACMCNYEDENLVESNKRIRQLMGERKLPMKSGMSTSTCPVTREQSGVTIDQHGRIYKCNSMLGHPELSTGDVHHDEMNEKHEEFMNLDVWQQCPQDCTYMPICSGGCRLSSFLQHQNFKTPSCHKPYLNKMAPEFIKRDYQKALAKRS